MDIQRMAANSEADLKMNTREMVAGSLAATKTSKEESFRSATLSSRAKRAIRDRAQALTATTKIAPLEDGSPVVAEWLGTDRRLRQVVIMSHDLVSVTYHFDKPGCCAYSSHQLRLVQTQQLEEYFGPLMD